MPTTTTLAHLFPTILGVLLATTVLTSAGCDGEEEEYEEREALLDACEDATNDPDNAEHYLHEHEVTVEECAELIEAHRTESDGDAPHDEEPAPHGDEPDPHGDPHG